MDGLKGQYGFIAQEVKEILPSVVTYDEHKKLYAVAYDAVIPVLVEAIKEQQAEIDNQQENATAIMDEMRELRKSNEAMASELKAIKSKLFKR